ncbi:hypothetical protein O0I10_013097 [Lichtheimia ornata]|uniref:Uncharacterized protein n=1 Tax=Lichtheimia ornata TaxID=688661 RepID=A0AAD7XP31_9FUNG|nr:uncharacterized protein O0I10_013097 [Lichtheimia ornata]KAJ8651379.1 hypothetical protein O0I10_013097 [Lichtheimia ornata]
MPTNTLFYVSHSASYLSVPFGFLMDAAIIGCRQGFIHMAIIVCVLFSKLLVFWSFGIFMDADESCQGQRATSTASFSVSLPYYIVRRFSLLYHLLDTSFYSICSGKATSSIPSRLIVVLVVDNPFNGYPATHACYWWIISATSKKQQRATEPTSLVSATFIDPLVVLVIGKLISRALFTARILWVYHISNRQQCYVSFWCCQGVSISHGIHHQVSLGETAIRIGHWVDISTARKCVLITGWHQTSWILI